MTIHANGAPRRFDISPFERVRETIAVDDAYDVAIYGPNGFLRHFEGSAESPLDVHCEYDFSSLTQLRLTIANRVESERVVTIRANAYVSEPDRIVTLGISTSSTQMWDVETSTDGWYDITVSLGEDFRWRFAGHIELGRASVSG